MDISEQFQELIDLTEDDDEVAGVAKQTIHEIVEVLKVSKQAILKNKTLKQEKRTTDTSQTTTHLFVPSEQPEHSESPSPPPQLSKRKQQRDVDLHSMNFTLPLLSYSSTTFWRDVCEMSQKRFQRGPYDTSLIALITKLPIDVTEYPPWLNQDEITLDMFPKYVKAGKRLKYIAETVRRKFKTRKKGTWKNHFLNNKQLRAPEIYRRIARDLDLLDISEELKKMMSEDTKHYMCWYICRQLVEIYSSGDDVWEMKKRKEKEKNKGMGIKQALRSLISSTETLRLS